MSTKGSSDVTPRRQYFEHPRCHLLNRRTASNNVDAPTIDGEDVRNEGSVNSFHLDKTIPKREVTPMMLLGIMYTFTMSGAYSIEETVMGGGILLALISIFVISIFMAAPTALVVSELASSAPSNAAFLMWINLSFPRVVYFVMIILSMLLIFIDNALYIVLFSDYVCTSIECGEYGHILLRACMLLVTYILNVIGVQAVGSASIMLSIATLMPFLIMFTMHIFQTDFYLNWPAISYIPEKIDWALFITTASWNLCGMEQAATLSEEIKAPHKTIIRALVPLWGLAYLTYIPPILLGASVEKGPPDLSKWEVGFWSYIGESLGGKPLQIFVVIASGLSAFGLLLSSLCTTTHTIAGVASTEAFPRLVNKMLYKRNGRFGTNHWTITINAFVTGLFGIFFSFGLLVKTNQVLYGIRVMMIFMSFFIMRRRYPHLHRPFRVPLEGYKALVLVFPFLLFFSLTMVAMFESTSTVIINLSVLAATIVFSTIYVYFIRNEGFYGRVVTELPEE